MFRMSTLAVTQEWGTGAPLLRCSINLQWRHDPSRHPLYQGLI